MQLSLKTLGLRKDIVSCWKIEDAPEPLQRLNLDGKVTLIWVVPTKLKKFVTINSRFSEQITGANVFAT
jgi:hypothetical protein